MRPPPMRHAPMPSGPRTPRNENDRDPYWGLTSLQMSELDDELSLAHHELAGDMTERYQAVANRFAMRAAVLLSGNDLRGALSAAEICRTALNLAEHSRRTLAIERARGAERLRAEREQPSGMLVAIKGHKRARRVYPDDPWPDGATMPDPRAYEPAGESSHPEDAS